MIRSYRPTDPLLSTQWHLVDIGRLGFTQVDSLAGMERIWADYRGAGVSVGIWDDGVQSGHWDLAANYDATRQITVGGTLNAGQPVAVGDNHGTAVAGLIAADDNGQGGVGVAPDAKITGVRIFGGADDINTQWARYLLTLDNLSRFDVTNHSYGSTPDYFLFADTAKFEASLAAGRGGLGTINVKSAGNHNTDGIGTALDASRATVSVAALTADGQVASYSAYGAHILVSAPAGSVTTDRLGLAGYNTATGGDYTNGFGGTSASAPVTAGVVSLMLDANDRLGWRDVQAILAYSAQATGSLVTGNTSFETSGWRTNGADNWNGGGLHYSNDYGFGMINAHAAVWMAEVWTLMQGGSAVSANEARAVTGTLAVNRAITDNATTSYNFNVGSVVELEHVGLTLTLTHSDWTDLRITLTSPDGTEISVFDGSSGTSATADFGLTYTFGLEGFRGELSNGLWTVRVSDVAAGDSGVLSSVGFTGYGAAETVNDVYHYTDEVLAALARTNGGTRLVLADTDGGKDWIDAAPMWRDLSLDLRAGTTSTLGGMAFLTIAAGAAIENAVGGDGNDTITGNDGDNILVGMRGNDVLLGGAGTDTAWFYGLSSDYAIVDQSGWFSVNSLSGIYGYDALADIEFARFDDMVVNLLAGFTDTVAPVVRAMTPAVGASLVDVGANIVLTFDEAVQAGSGYFVIQGWDGTYLAMGATDGQVSFSGNTVTINPTGLLTAGLSYYVVVSEGAVLDQAQNAVAAWGSATQSAFTTRPAGNMIVGTAANNVLNGTGAADLMQGLAGNDTLSGGAGNDTLHGGTGFDRMSGGPGDDVYSVDSTRDLVSEGANAGFDTVRTVLASYTLGSNVEGVVYEGVDKFTGTGNALGNMLQGGDGNDLLSGLAGSDTIVGGAGADRIIGGAGLDVLYGMAGADTFVFAVRTDSTAAAADVIMDFVQGQDRIDLAMLDGNALLSSRQAFGTQIVTDFTGIAGQLRVSMVDGGVLVQGDVDGNYTADFAIRVFGPTGLLTAGDFIF
ncbi:S8 family serine peptidase [Paragemmobacter aquarius]|nr:S8 family serine peptidase [Gemmobacter aquarius]